MEKILIIDDDKLSLKLIREILERSGYQISEAEDGESALKMIRSVHPSLVVSDFQLPGINGLEVLAEIRKLNSGLPVILLTGHGDVPLTIRSIQRGAFDYLEKPIDPAQLRNTVHKALFSAKVSRGLNELPHDNSSPESLFHQHALVGKTPQMKEIYKNIGRISRTKINVLIEGEIGTEKELTAKLIHYSSISANHPFIQVNCQFVPETLLESELFGENRGAYLNSIQDKRGKFELAGEGTVFLDDVSALSPGLQVKLLGVLQKMEFEHVGGEDPIPMRARLIMASNQDLEAMVTQGLFREDLYSRLKVFTLKLPPLRERKEDIRDLVIHLLFQLNNTFDSNVVKIGSGVIELLTNHDWPGNLHELENTILQAMVLSKNDVLELENISINQTQNLPTQEAESATRYRSIADLERYHIKQILEQSRWNKLEASRILEITRPTLNAKIEKYHLHRD